jgi:hypothetical protein
MQKRKGLNFPELMLPAPVGGGFRVDESASIWCGSVIRGEDGRYHMFASRIPRGEKRWTLDSEVVRASADTPIGPYQFEEMVLPRRGPQYWDGMMTHNPTIHKCGGTYLLYYTGSTHDPAERDFVKAWRAKRIGLATAKSVFGPWTRRAEPILAPRPDRWDSGITSNPAPCVHPDGSVILVYKSTSTGFRPDQGEWDTDMRLGVAGAAHYEGPYHRLSDEPILKDYPIEAGREKKFDLEDAFIWYGSDGYHMLVKCFFAGQELIGEFEGGLHAVSPDGVHWCLANPMKGYSRTVVWDDGQVITHEKLERVQALIENDVMTHLIFASRCSADPRRSQSVVIPLKPFKV